MFIFSLSNNPILTMRLGFKLPLLVWSELTSRTLQPQPVASSGWKHQDFQGGHRPQSHVAGL